MLSLSILVSFKSYIANATLVDWSFFHEFVYAGRVISQIAAGEGPERRRMQDQAVECLVHDNPEDAMVRLV